MKNSLAICLALLLVGCGGGASESSSTAAQTSFEQQQSDSQIAEIYLGDNSVLNVPIEDIDLNSAQTILTISQNHVSNVNYGSDKISFIRMFYDDLQGVIRFTHFYDYSDNTYSQQELGYDLTRKQFVYMNYFSSGEMGVIVNLASFSVNGTLEGSWEGGCLHEIEQNQNRITSDSRQKRKINISGNNIEIYTYNCMNNQLVETFKGRFESKVMYDEFSKKNVIVVKDPETKAKHMAPKRFLISSDGKILIRFFGVNTYAVYHKTN